MANWQDQIGQFRVISDGEEARIQQILRQYPFLVEVLREAFDRIQVYFPGSQVFLHTTSDPEATHAGRDDNPAVGENEELVAYISTALPPEEAVEALERLYDDWWITTSISAKGKISIGLECL